MANQEIDGMQVTFSGEYSQLESVTSAWTDITDSMSAMAEEASASISESFSMIGEAASSFAEMSQMAADNAAQALGTIPTAASEAAANASEAGTEISDSLAQVTPATEEVDSSFSSMADNISISITEVNAQISEMSSNAESASSSISESTGSSGGSFMDLFNKVGFGIMNFQNFANIAQQVGGALLSPAENAETVTTALTTLDGSAQAANVEMQKLNEFAAKTPFKTLDIDQAAEKLQGFGISANDVVPELTAIGDALGSVGKGTPAEMQSVVDIFGKINTEGKVTQQTMNELAVHGINGWQALADATGKTIPQVKQMVKDGLLPANDAINDLTKGIEMNPLYAGGMAKAAGTFTGLLSTLQSNWDQVIAAFGTPILKALEPELNNLGNTLSSPAFQSFAGSIGQGIVNVFQGIGNAVSTVVDYLKKFDLTGITYSFGQLGNAVGNILSPLEKLGSNKAASDFFSSLKNDLSQGIVTAIKDVSGFIDGLAHALTSLSGNSSVSGFLSSLGDGFQKVSGIVGGTLQQNFKTFSQTAQDLGKWWQSTMSPAIQQAMPGFQKLGSIIATTVAPAIATLWSDGQKIARDLLPPLTKAFETIAPILVKVGGIIADNLGKAIQFLTPYITQAAGAITDFAGQIIQRVQPIIELLWSQIQNGLNFILPIWNAVWPSMQEVLQGVWNTISGAVQIAWSIVSGVVKVGLDLLSGNWSGAWNDIKSTFSGVWNGIQTELNGVWTTIKGAISGGINAVIGFINDFINGLDTIHVSLPGGNSLGFSIPDIPTVHFAMGGNASPNTVFEAGENGPELIFSGPAGASVMNNTQTMAALSGGNQPVHIHNHIYIDGREISNSVMTQVMSQIRSSGHPLGQVA